MTMYRLNSVPANIRAMPILQSASGSIATFDTDRAERLVKCVCEVASGASEINVVACGKNLWNETTRNGYYSVSTGIYQGVTGQLCTQGYIAVKPNTTYYVYKGSNANIGEGLFYDENKTYINYITPANFNNHTFTTPINCHYITFNLGNGYGTTYNNNISVNYPSTETQYHAYNGNTYNIQFGETLTDTATYDAISGVLTRNDSTTKQLDSCNIVALDNETNNVYCDTGDTELNYWVTINKYIGA